MDIKTKDQKGSVSVWPEKLYTQHEVNDLLDKREDDSIPRQMK